MALSGNNGGGGHGPIGGSTPDNDDDLHTGGNPYSQGAPATDAFGDTNTPYRVGSVPGYFQNPHVSAGNPYAGAPPDHCGPANDAGLGAGLDATYRETLSNQRDGYGSEPNVQDYYIDNGVGFDEAVPPDKQR
jgi:hypothetical protein